MSGGIRPAAVAGSFYPADPDLLRELLRRELSHAAAQAPSGPPPKALIAPHAGYVYSGPIAASAYARVLPLQGHIERVVLLGPAHTVALSSIATASAAAFATPLGMVPVDAEARDELIAEGLVICADAAHEREHSLEVHLPFLQIALGNFRLLPLVVGRVPEEAVTAVLDRIWDGPETLVVVSTDLSHYHSQQKAQELDRHTATAILAMRGEDLRPEDACGVFPLRGLLTVARQRNLEVELVDLRTSADTAGSPHQVVGYGSFTLR